MPTFHPLWYRIFFIYHWLIIQKLYLLSTQCICVFCAGLKRRAVIGSYNVKWLVFVTAAERVYSAVRTEYLKSNSPLLFLTSLILTLCAQKLNYAYLKEVLLLEEAEKSTKASWRRHPVWYLWFDSWRRGEKSDQAGTSMQRSFFPRLQVWGWDNVSAAEDSRHGGKALVWNQWRMRKRMHEMREELASQQAEIKALQCENK